MLEKTELTNTSIGKERMAETVRNDGLLGKDNLKFVEKFPEITRFCSHNITNLFNLVASLQTPIN